MFRWVPGVIQGMMLILIHCRFIQNSREAKMVKHTLSETDLWVPQSCSSRGAQTSACMCWWIPGFSKEREGRGGRPVLECGSDGSDGGRNRWSLNRSKTKSVRPCVRFWLQVFRDERPFPPQPPRIYTMVSVLLSMYTEVPTTKDVIWEAVRPGACPCSTPLSLCTGRSLCLTESEPELPCSLSLALPEEVSPAWAFYVSLAGSGHIWPGCKPLASAIDECRLCTGRTWTPVRLWSQWPPLPVWSRKATPGFLR